MTKFETLFTVLYEDATGITGAPSANTSAQVNTTAPTTSQTPATNTPATFDQQHPLIQQLAKTTDPAAVVKLLQDNKIALPAAQAITTA
jgi:hypothetical protein